ncbi:peptidoglycan/LPS O-acetylase OafA/YrhL [Pelomonas aquatica]|uniref:Peptidoglycan/LPS O-acetylase OafA/YrhL n=1 Tax=Pelomonas aquatica TaxID=431058 RepID=A0ABU1Z2P4_9BURK|nr:acyltransferase family protein [Pelomonas aquatica]MDR7294880.1 peptidoglycan/LPS O-acetylase OafA/YrhL [Pelomonas aquatica]
MSATSASLALGAQSHPGGVLATTRFNPGLQGMRGVAILLVLLNHAAVPGFGGGYVGVDVFFVISGYLIGGLLLRELETKSGLDLWAFYARRVRRLLPAAALVLAVTVVGIRLLYAPQEQDELLSSARAAALYAGNLWFASRPTDYFGGHTEANPALHLWSLAVEEQFYLFWPLLMLLAVRLFRGTPRAVTGGLLLVLGGLSFAACVVVSLINFKYTFFLTPFRIWEFAVGMAISVWPGLAARWSGRAVAAMGWVAVGTLCAVSLLFDGRMRFPGFWAAFPVAAAALLLVVVQHGRQSMVGRLLQSSGIRQLGDCSYSVYLWHWPVLIGAAVIVPEPAAWMTVCLLALSVGLGWLSYRFVEQPFMHALFPALSARQVVLAGLGLCVAVAAGAQFTRKFIHVGPEQERFERAARWDLTEATGCLTLADAVDQPACEYGADQPTATVVLFGDSHASQWFVPLQQLALKHQLRLVVLTKSACPSVDVPVAVYTTLGDYRECTLWRERMLQRIEAMRPAVVVMASSSGYSIEPGRWQAGLDRTVTRLQRAGVQVGYLKDIPFPGFNVPGCHARAAWRSWSIGGACTYRADDEEARIAPLATAEEAVLMRRGATFINLSRAICNEPVCRTARDGLVMFKDRNHLTEEFALSLAPDLEKPLLQLLKQSAATRQASPS